MHQGYLRVTPRLPHGEACPAGTGMTWLHSPKGEHRLCLPQRGQQHLQGRCTDASPWAVSSPGSCSDSMENTKKKEGKGCDCMGVADTASAPMAWGALYGKLIRSVGNQGENTKPSMLSMFPVSFYLQLVQIPDSLFCKDWIWAFSTPCSGYLCRRVAAGAVMPLQSRGQKVVGLNEQLAHGKFSTLRKTFDTFCFSKEPQGNVSHRSWLLQAAGGGGCPVGRYCQLGCPLL